MKCIFKIAGVAIGLLVLAVAVLFAVTFMGRQAIPKDFEINGIHIVKDGIVSVAVVPIGKGEVALIDAGNDASGEAILAELSRRQLGSDAVKAVLLTHGHPDHIAAIPLFPGATVPVDDIPKMWVLMTMVGGKVVHMVPSLARKWGMQPVGAQVELDGPAARW
ncbi:MAG: MBL fold metallo-hydrolase [SAR324 cluster bacterium]|nr:MBL fold metallo-hydrolase [SAR324 cluster bacterium]